MSELWKESSSHHPLLANTGLHTRSGTTQPLGVFFFKIKRRRYKACVPIQSPFISRVFNLHRVTISQKHINWSTKDRGLAAVAVRKAQY